MSCCNTVEPLNNGHVEDENFVHCSEVVLSSEVATVKMNECLCVCVSQQHTVTSKALYAAVKKHFMGVCLWEGGGGG